MYRYRIECFRTKNTGYYHVVTKETNIRTLSFLYHFSTIVPKKEGQLKMPPLLLDSAFVCFPDIYPKYDLYAGAPLRKLPFIDDSSSKGRRRMRSRCRFPADDPILVLRSSWSHGVLAQSH